MGACSLKSILIENLMSYEWLMMLKVRIEDEIFAKVFDFEGFGGVFWKRICWS